MSQVGSQLAAASAAGSAASPTTPAGMPPASAAGFSAVSAAAASAKAPSAAGSRAPSAVGSKAPSAVGSQRPSASASAVGGGGGGGGSQVAAASAVPSAHASHVSHASRQTTAAQGVVSADAGSAAAASDAAAAAADADALAADIGPSASEVGVAAPPSASASAAPEPASVAPEPVTQEAAPPAAEAEASSGKPAVRKAGGGPRRKKKQARADVGGYADVMGEDVGGGGGGGGGGDELRYSREPDRSAALAGMQDKVVLPEAVQQHLADKQRRISEQRRANRDTGSGYPGPHQAGIPRHLLGNVQPQDYGSEADGHEDPYVAFASPERDNTDYRLCAACNTPLAATPFCPMTGRRHATGPSLTPAASSASPALSPYSAGGGGGSGSVLPAHVPAHRGASFHSTSYPSSPAAAAAGPSSPYQPYQQQQQQLRTLPLTPPAPGTGASATMSVCESLPYADEEDLRPMAMDELRGAGGGGVGAVGRSVIGEAGIDWHRVKHLADQYARARDQVRAGSAAAADRRYGATDPDGRLRGVSPPRVSPYSPNVASMVRGYASPPLQQQQHVPVVGGVGSVYGTPSPRVRRTAL